MAGGNVKYLFEHSCVCFFKALMMGGGVSLRWLMRVCVSSARLPACGHATTHLCSFIRVFASTPHLPRALVFFHLTFTAVYFADLLFLFPSVREISKLYNLHYRVVGSKKGPLVPSAHIATQ